MNAQKMDLKTWYGSSVKIPNYSSPDYSTFAASCLGILHSIVNRHLATEISVLFCKIPTAAADQENKAIYINNHFLQGNFRADQDALEPHETLTSLMGIVIHEAAHFAWSPKLLTDWSEYVKKHSSSRLFSEDMAKFLGNTTEDIYIEAEIGRTVPGLFWMLERLNEVMFGEAYQEKVLSEAKPITASPTTMQEVVAVANALILAKFKEEVSVNPYFDRLFALTRTVTDMTDIQDRFKLTRILHDSLMSHVKEMNEQEKVSVIGSGIGGGGEEGEEKEETLGQAIKKLIDNASGLTAKDKDKAANPKNDYSNNKAANEGREVTSRFETLKTFVLTRNEEADTKAPHMSYYLEKTVPTADTCIEMDERYVRLAELGRQTATVNKPYGLDRTRGHSMRRLWRIATDSKIFAERVPMKDFKPFEVLILLDTSGSMRQPVEGLYTTMGFVTRKEAASKAVYGAAYGLTQARCNVAVYAHAASNQGLDEVNVHMLKTFNEPVELLGRRLKTLVYSPFYSGDNRDGYALTYVARKFQAQNRRRIIIVISDGFPNANYYKGETGIVHTRESVDRIRSQGIEVLSISIARDAVAANDRIYGKENNIFNQDPNVIEKIVQRYLTQ